MNILLCDICTNTCCNRKGKSKTSIFENEVISQSIKTEIINGKRFLKNNEDGDCLSLKNGLCSNYEDRPITCSTYPFSINERNELFISTTCFSTDSILKNINNPEVLEYLKNKFKEMRLLPIDVKQEMGRTVSKHIIQIKINI